MDVNVIYNVHHEMPFGAYIATYFYLTGLSAGSFVISVVAVLFGKAEYKPLAKIGCVLAPLLLILAPLFLLIDLTQPLRFWHLFVYLNLASPVTWGSFLLTLYPISSLIYAYFVFTNNVKLSKVFGVIGIPLAVSVHGYTGFIVGLAKARVLWNTSIMPILFLVSAMVSGVALVILIAVIRTKFFSKGKELVEIEKDRKLIVGLGGMLAGLIAFDLFLTFSDILVLLVHTEDALAIVNLVRFGLFKYLFFGAEIIAGSLVPIVLLSIPKLRESQLVLAVASVLVLIGIYTMRYILVIGGQAIPQT